MTWAAPVHPSQPVRDEDALEEARDDGDWERYLLTFGRNGAPEALLDLVQSGEIDTNELRRLLCGVWSGAEWPCRYLPRSQWVEWFRLVGFVSESGSAQRPTERVEVWRGQSGPSIGLAWSNSEEQGRWFYERNKRMGRPSRLLHGFAPPDRVLAIIDSDDGRKEGEVLVDTTKGRFWKVVKP